MLVVSPHLDDGVLGCGALLVERPGAVVLTVFAGTPRDPGRRTDWDARCGFADAGAAMAERRQEDDRALRLVGATARRLGFCDSQYEETPTVDAVAAALAELLRAARPGLLLYPLGLFHSDHRLVHDATRVALRGLPDLRALVYEDALYRGMHGVLHARLAELAGTGLVATPARLGTAVDGRAAKARAVQAYASQLCAFGPDGLDDAAQPERFWSLEEKGAAG